MKRTLLLLALAALPGHAAMDITRELVAPERLVPGQPARVAVTFWTDSWFNPPPQWPDFAVQNGGLLTTPLPNQLLTRQKDGVSWSGVRLERQLMAWDRGMLRLPAQDMTLRSQGQPPVTVHLPAIEKAVNWPDGVEQPDRFLPARQLTLSQAIRQHHAGKDRTLRVGDAVDRIVTLKAQEIIPTQIPQLLYAIPGDGAQRLSPVNRWLKSERGDVEGAIREEHLRYLPSRPGNLTLPPVKLRWWDTESQQWQVAELEGATLKVAPARAAGSESVLRGAKDSNKWQTLGIALMVIILAVMLWVGRHPLCRSGRWLAHRGSRFWRPVPLPGLAPQPRSKR